MLWDTDRQALGALFPNSRHSVPQSRISDKCLGDHASFTPSWGSRLYEYDVHTLGSLKAWGPRGLGVWPGGRGEDVFIPAKPSCLRQWGTGNGEPGQLVHCEPHHGLPAMTRINSRWYVQVGRPQNNVCSVREDSSEQQHRKVEMSTRRGTLVALPGPLLPPSKSQ